MGAYTVPTTFLNNTDEAKEEAEKLGAETAKQAAKQAAKDQANRAEKKPVQAATKSPATKKPDTEQKIKKQAAAEKAADYAAPAKKDAPVKRFTVSFPSARVVLVSAALFFAATMALRSNSSGPTGAAEVVTTKSYTKSVSSSWADASNDQQCGLYDNNDFCAVPEAFETTCSVHFPAT